MLLLELLRSYELEKAVGPYTVGQYRKSIETFGEHLGRPPLVEDLTTANVNAWLAAMEPKYQPISLKNKKAGLTAMWNYAADLRLVEPYNSHRLRRIRVPREPVNVWEDAEIAALMKAADEMPGRLRCGIAVAPLLVAYVRVNFETGLRQNDMRALRRASIDDSGLIQIVQKKTKNPHVCRLSLDTLAIIDSTGASDREQIWPLTKWGWNVWTKKLLRAAGLTRGLSTLRKSHATAVYRERGKDAAAQSLGHAVVGTRVVLAHLQRADHDLGVDQLPQRQPR